MGTWGTLSKNKDICIYLQILPTEVVFHNGKEPYITHCMSDRKIFEDIVGLWL